MLTDKDIRDACRRAGVGPEATSIFVRHLNDVIAASADEITEEPAEEEQSAK